MNAPFKSWATLLVALSLWSVCGHAAADQQKPRVTILATGGTIAGAAATGTQSGYKSGAVTIDTAVSADGPLNLFNAVGVAADPRAKGRGVMVVMNDQIHAAHSLTKTSTTAVETFMSPGYGLIGAVSYGKNDFYSSPTWKHTTQSEFDISKVTNLPRVDVVFADIDMPADLIDASVAAGAKGIVIAGVGNGNMNKASVDAAEKAARSGVIVVRASRVPTGLVGRNVELDDDKLGFIASYELNPQKARVLLSLALLEKRSLTNIQNLYELY